MYKKILLAYDGSQSGQKALLDCREIAQWSQASLTLIAVTPLAIATLLVFVILPDGFAVAKRTEGVKAEASAPAKH